MVFVLLCPLYFCPGGAGGAADAAMRQAQANAAAEDPAAKIQKLTQMRDSGLITPEEFETKKQEILSSM